jgi:hypothetical protein
MAMMGIVGRRRRRKQGKVRGGKIIKRLWQKRRRFR